MVTKHPTMQETLIKHSVEHKEKDRSPVRWLT